MQISKPIFIIWHLGTFIAASLGWNIESIPVYITYCLSALWLITVGWTLREYKNDISRFFGRLIKRRAVVRSNQVNEIKVMSKSEYDSLEEKDPKSLYFVNDGDE